MTHASLKIAAVSGLVRRSLGFTQDVYQRMHSIGADLYVVRLDAEVYPALQFRPLEGHLGLIAGYAGAVAGSVRDQNYGENYPVEKARLAVLACHPSSSLRWGWCCCSFRE